MRGETFLPKELAQKQQVFLDSMEDYLKIYWEQKQKHPELLDSFQKHLKTLMDSKLDFWLLNLFQNNKTHAANFFGYSRPTLRKKLNKAKK